MTYNSVTVWQAAHDTYLFIWTPDSTKIGVIRVDSWGVIQSHQAHTHLFARRVYRDLLRLGGRVVKSAGTTTLPDYKKIISDLLVDIK